MYTAKYGSESDTKFVVDFLKLASEDSENYIFYESSGATKENFRFIRAALFDDDYRLFYFLNTADKICGIVILTNDDKTATVAQTIVMLAVKNDCVKLIENSTLPKEFPLKARLLSAEENDAIVSTVGLSFECTIPLVSNKLEVYSYRKVIADD